MLKQQFPDVPILALTATATRRVCLDLLEILRISACETFHTSVDRPNLYYSVRCLICIMSLEPCAGVIRPSLMTWHVMQAGRYVQRPRTSATSLIAAFTGDDTPSVVVLLSELMQ